MATLLGEAFDSALTFTRDVQLETGSFEENRGGWGALCRLLTVLLAHTWGGRGWCTEMRLGNKNWVRMADQTASAGADHGSKLRGCDGPSGATDQGK